MNKEVLWLVTILLIAPLQNITDVHGVGLTEISQPLPESLDLTPGSIEVTGW
jgi:hypothetical protein